MKPTEPEEMDKRLERALYLIQSEWGYSRKRALAWLEDDDYEWGQASDDEEQP